MPIQTPTAMNYFEYFSEIEEHFVARRGSALLLSPLDWALIEVWREAGVSLAAVLRGIDAAFDKYEARKARSRGRLAKVNGLAWCTQAVMEAAGEMAEAATGSQPDRRAAPETGFEAVRVAAYLDRHAETLERVAAGSTHAALQAVMSELAVRLRTLASEVRAGSHLALDDLDRHLSVLEERLHAGLVTHLPEMDLLAVREAADRELAPLRAKLGAVQGRQVREGLVMRRLLEAQGLPRLSLFYMPLAETGETEA